MRWEAASDSSGYAYFTVRNDGDTPATATCTVQVGDDFGDFGFDYMTGQLVQPGQTISGQAALNVGKNAALINRGSVTSC